MNPHVIVVYGCVLADNDKEVPLCSQYLGVLALTSWDTLLHYYRLYDAQLSVVKIHWDYYFNEALIIIPSRWYSG